MSVFSSVLWKLHAKLWLSVVFSCCTVRSVLTGSCTVNLMGKYSIGLGMGMEFFASQ